MVTHPTTNLPAHGLSTAERTGSPVFHVLWSIAKGIVNEANICKQLSVVSPSYCCQRMLRLVAYAKSRNPTRPLFWKYMKETSTHLCGPWRYFNCHIFPVLIDSWVLRNNCGVGWMGRGERSSMGMYNVGERWDRSQHGCVMAATRLRASNEVPRE